MDFNFTPLFNFSQGGKKIIIMTIGNILNSDDGIGPEFFQRFKEQFEKSAYWKIINAELMPENFIRYIINSKPSHLIILDAIEGGFVAGDIIFFNENEISSYEKLSTHGLPLSFIIKEIKYECEMKFLGIGIQVETTEFGINSISKKSSNSIDKLGQYLVSII